MTEILPSSQAEQDADRIFSIVQQGGQLSESDRWDAINLYDNIAINPEGTEATILNAEGETEAIENIEAAKRVREISNEAHTTAHDLEEQAKTILEDLSKDKSGDGIAPSRLHHISFGLDIGENSASFLDIYTGQRYPFNYQTALAIREADLKDTVNRLLSHARLLEGGANNESLTSSAYDLYQRIAIDGERATIQVAEDVSVPLDIIKAKQIKEIAEQSRERIGERARSYYDKLDYELDAATEDLNSLSDPVDDARQAVASAHEQAQDDESASQTDSTQDHSHILAGVAVKTRGVLSRLGQEDRGSIDIGGVLSRLGQEDRGSIDIERHLSAKDSIQDLVEEIKRQLYRIDGNGEEVLNNPHFLPHGPTQGALLKGYRSLLIGAQKRAGLLTENDGPRNANHTMNMTETQLAKVFLGDVQGILESDNGVEKLCAYAIHEQRKAIQKAYAHLHLPSPMLILQEDRRPGGINPESLADGDAANAVLDKYRKRLAWEEESIWKMRKPTKLSGFELRRPAERQVDPNGTQIRWLGGKEMKSERLRRILWKIGFGQH